MEGKTEVVCAVCGGEVTAKDPQTYPYCKTCHFTGQAGEHRNAEKLAEWRAAFPEATVSVEHTGGGCFWLAFRWADDPVYYCATDGGGGVPFDLNGEEGGPSGWGIVCRYEDDESSPDYEGTAVLLDDNEASTDEQVVAAIRADRAERSAR